MGRNQRKKNLIRPVLQLKLTLVFLATSASMAALMAYLVVNSLEGRTIGDTEVLPALLPALMRSFWITVAIMIPATLVVGILATFMVAGPLHRLELFLKAVIAGERPADCHLRDGDELQSFCDLLNEATAPLRVAESGDEASREREHADAA